jgi:FkbM family methyltransferase
MKIKQIILDLKHTKVLNHWYITFVFYYALTKIVSLLSRSFKNLNNINTELQRHEHPQFLIQNKIGIFKVCPFDDSMTIVSNYFENDLIQKLNLSNTRKSIFIDIGANLGKYSIVATKKYNFKKTYAFEANPDVASLLRENIALNNINEQVTVIEHALGSKKETINFIQNKIQKGMSKVANANEKTDKINNVIELETDTFDSLAKKYNIDAYSIDFIKIDVEGYEKNVLEGMNETLSAINKGTKLIIEISQDTEDCLSILGKYGFTILEEIGLDYVFEKNN